jgi:hypothetical protein
MACQRVGLGLRQPALPVTLKTEMNLSRRQQRRQGIHPLDPVMEHFHSAQAGEFANPCESFFLCSLRFLLLVHFPIKGYPHLLIEI